MTAVARRRVAVIGAGIAGLACARQLAARGVVLVVYEKSKGAGGRVATRLSDAGGFDHGAQYFTVRNHRFEAFAQRLVQQGVVQRWSGRLVAFAGAQSADVSSATERFVGVPAMNDLGRAMSAGLDIRYGKRVDRIERRNGRWIPCDESGQALSVHGFDTVCVALPSPQAAELLRGVSSLADTAAGIRWDPCWAAMVGLGQPTEADFAGAFIEDDPILGWISRDSAKPGRTNGPAVAERWVLHAHPNWSRAFLELEPRKAAQWMVQALATRLGRPLEVRHLIAHRWRYATPTNPVDQPFLWDASLRIGAAGDWCGGPRIEGAWLSGTALAEAVIG